MAKRYQLGVMDLYPLAVMDESIEDSPTVGVSLDADVDAERLHRALCRAAELFPLFKAKIVFDGGYWLEENDAPILLFNENDFDRTFTWKKGTNGYPWKMTYHQNRILLRWCHAITDGRGAERFLGAVLNLYYGVPYSVEPELELGLEPFFDENEKGIPQKKQPAGFGAEGLKIAPHAEKQSTMHVLKCKTADVLALSKRSNASPATVIPPLYSRALRACMKQKKSVRFNIVVDVRVPMGHKSMHNCIFFKVISYLDRFDTMPFEQVSTIYRALLDLGCQKENVVVEATNNIKTIGEIAHHPDEATVKQNGRRYADDMKNADSDATFTYLGKVDYGAEVNRHLLDYTFCSWTDFGYCNVAATDLNGVFTMFINEAYEDKRVIPEFIRAAGEEGLEIREVDRYPYYRADKLD